MSMPQSENNSKDFVESAAELKGSDYEAIFDFLEDLRTVGFRFGTQQYIDLHRVLVTLTASGQTEINAEKLKTYLAPIVCTSPDEQNTFYSHFDNWLRKRDLGRKNNETELSPLADNLAQQSKFVKPRRIMLWFSAFALLTLLIISAVFIPNLLYPIPVDDLTVYKVGTIKGQVIDEDKQTPLGGAEILFNNGTEETDQDGGFTLNYETFQNKADIVVNYPNYPLKIESVELVSGEQIVPITMKQPIQTVAPEKQVVENTISKPTEQPENTQPTTAADQVEIKPAHPEAEPVKLGSWNQFYRRNFIYLVAVAAAAPILYFCLWWLLRRRRRVRLARKTSDEIPQLGKLIVKGVKELLYKSAAMRRTIQELRRHRPQDSTDLNVPATIDATIERGGAPKPIFGTRKTSPEYLILIDRASFSDQEALLKEVLINRLIEEGVYVDRYYFDRDPRVCYKTPQSKTFSLTELAARHPEHNLAVFSDGASFFDPLTALPQRWFETFSLWVRRALLTPASSDSWGYRETVLTESEFPVLPATKEGIAGLVDVINTGQKPKIASNETIRQFPEILEERPLRWLHRHAPSLREIDELYRQLRRYLDAEEFYLLCACSVYPALSLELTLYLGYKLGGDVERLEDELFSLVRLPWFRHGKMPDWLRQRLLSGLSARQEKEIRAAIEQLLITALEHPQEGLSLEFAFNEEKYKKDREKLKRFILGEPEDSPLRDYVFLSFMTRNHLTVAVPEVLRHFLFPEGVHWLGVRPAAFFLLVLLISLGATTTTAYFLPIPNMTEAPAPPIEPTPPPQFSRTEPLLSYSPASGIRGGKYEMRFVSNDCESEKLSNAKLDSLEETGITVLSNQAEGECVLNATIVIASDAEIGKQTLLLTREGRVSEAVQFMITDVPKKPQPVIVNRTVSPELLPPVACAYIEIDCPDVLFFQTTKLGLESQISSNGSGIAGAEFTWSIESIEDPKSIFTIIDGQGTASIKIKAEPSLLLIAQRELTVRMRYSDNIPECAQNLLCRTKAKFGDGVEGVTPKSSTPTPKPTETITPTPPIANTPPDSFSVYYQFEDPVKGWRIWQRKGNTSWTETYPNGVVSYFRVVGRTEVFGNKGTLIAKIKGGLGDTPDDGSFQVFIPDLGSKDMIALFRHANGEWASLGEMQNVR